MKIEEDAYAITQIFFKISKFFAFLIIFALAGFFFTHPSMKKHIELLQEKKIKKLLLLKTKKKLKQVEAKVNKEKSYIKKNKFNRKLYKKDRSAFLKLFNVYTPNVKLYFKSIKESKKYHNCADVELKVKYGDPDNIQPEQIIVIKVIGMLKIPSEDMYPVTEMKDFMGRVRKIAKVRFKGKHQEIASYEVCAKIKQ